MKKIKKTKTDIAREYIKEITGADIVKTELQRTYWNTKKEVYMEKAYLLDGEEISSEKGIRNFADELLSNAEDIRTIKDAGKNISVRGGCYSPKLYIDGICCKYGNTDDIRFIARYLRGELTISDKMMLLRSKIKGYGFDLSAHKDTETNYEIMQRIEKELSKFAVLM